MADNRMEVVLIELNSIQPNSYNPNTVSDDILAKLSQEIAQKGLTVPIIVRSRGYGYVIVDGFHRWLICRNLGYKEIPCIIQDFSENEAKIKILQLNYMRGQAVPIKLASLIHELSKEIKLEDLAKRLPYEEIQLKDNLELLKLPDDFGKSLELKAQEEADELPSVISFVVYKKQLAVIEEAIRIALETLPREAKNLRALALEKICAHFIADQGDPLEVCKVILSSSGYESVRPFKEPLYLEALLIPTADNVSKEGIPTLFKIESIGKGQSLVLQITIVPKR